MAVAPGLDDIFDRAVQEGERRLDQSLLELASTSFIAGFTVVFGVVALGIVEASVEPHLGDVARVAGALAFGVGLVFLVVGRTELFNENFFDPTAAAIERADPRDLAKLGRLWLVTLLFNLLAGFLFALVFTVEGTVPPGTAAALGRVAEEAVARPALAWFASAIAGGALVALLSHLLMAVNTVGSRIWLAWAVGFLLALGPFDHVVVTAIHVFFGIRHGAPIAWGPFVWMLAVVTAGNLVGGLGLVTFTHVTQVMGTRDSDG